MYVHLLQPEIKMLDKCDISLPSVCFGKENMRL